MTGNLYIDLAVSLGGILFVVALIRFMFADADVEISEQLAIDRLKFDEPDFEPAAWLIDDQAKIALARSDSGEIAVVKAMGGDFITRRFARGVAIASIQNNMLTIEPTDHTWRAVSLNVSEVDAAQWLGCFKKRE